MNRCTESDHARAVADDAEWATWPRIGNQAWPWGDVWEQRNCPKCNSTRARQIAWGEEEVSDADAA